MNNPERRLAQSMLLPEVELAGIRYSKQGLFLEIFKITNYEICLRCAGRSEDLYDHKWVEIKDSPIRSRAVILRVKKRRFYCRPCKRVFTEPVQGILPRRRSTQRYRKEVMEACESYTSLSRVREAYGCSSSFIYSTLYEQLELRRRTRMYPWPEVIGIDEISFRRDKKKGVTEFASVIVDMKNKRVMELVQGKRGEDLKRALAEIPGRENVKWVAIDMCDPFRKFVKEFFPNAKIVADKFHALRLVTPAILRVLKEELGASALRWQMRKWMLRRPDRLGYFERSRLHAVLAKYPKLAALYAAKECLFHLYRTTWIQGAFSAFNRLGEKLEDSPYAELTRLGRTLWRWRDEVMAYFQSGITNGRTEGFNNKIKLVKRMAYGYRSFRNFRLRVLNACAG